VKAPRQQPGGCGLHTIQTCCDVLIRGEIPIPWSRPADDKFWVHLIERVASAIVLKGLPANIIADFSSGDDKQSSDVLRLKEINRSSKTLLNVEVIYILIMRLSRYREPDHPKRAMRRLQTQAWPSFCQTFSIDAQEVETVRQNSDIMDFLGHRTTGSSAQYKLRLDLPIVVSSTENMLNRSKAVWEEAFTFLIGLHELFFLVSRPRLVFIGIGLDPFSTNNKS
jgi:hypothetical protein